jgi:hypothetical protein
MRILKFNESQDDEIFDYIKHCFIDITDSQGIYVDEPDGNESGVMFTLLPDRANGVGDVYIVAINKYGDIDNSGKVDDTFERIYKWAKEELEYIQDIKDAIDKVKVRYPNCTISAKEHEYYEIYFYDIK